ncbi:MAG: hypothetical protein BWK76_10795 [Desulfobulbaceae bacterium A2]|nr:MAG: hypothetical protein BWK76_10795 [Desulfobulbaceae bacterium A2]
MIALARLTAISAILYLATGLFYDRLLTGLATAADKPRGPMPAATPAPAPTSSAAPAPDTAVPADLRLILERNIFQGGGAQPGQRAESAAEALVLLGTVIGQERRAVLRHGQGQGLFREGDTVAGARIERIERQRVTLKRQGREEVLLVEARRAETGLAARHPETQLPTLEEGETAGGDTQPQPLSLPRAAVDAAARSLLPRTAVKADPLLSPPPAPANPAHPRQAPVAEKTTP